MSAILLNCGLVLLFILVGGVFAAAEIALVSLREGQVKALSERGGRRGSAVARLTRDPNRFLAAVQVGVTLAGFLSAAFGAATLSDSAARGLIDLGVPKGAATPLALVGVTLVVSYFSLVLGELVPKRLGLQRAEGTARLLAPTVDRIATIVRPVIWLLSRSTDLVVRLLGNDPQAQKEAITEEELRDLVAAHESLSTEERKLIDEVFAAGERQVREVMIPRTEVEFLDAALPVSQALELTAKAPHSRYPVVRGSQDDVVGFLHVRDLFHPDTDRERARVGDVARDVELLPSTKKVLAALSEMRRGGHHIAVVVDEYGGTAGIVTLEDLIEELVGDIRDEYDQGAADAQRLAGGDVEVDGLLNLDDFVDETGLELPDGPYETAAGYVMSRLGHLPTLGDSVELNGSRITVTGLDGRRVERLRVARNVSDGSPESEGQGPVGSIRQDAQPS